MGCQWTVDSGQWTGDDLNAGQSPQPAGKGDDEYGGGAKILLSRNFRSQAGILDAVNYVFSRIMSIEFGEIDYTEREYLIPGRESDAGRNNGELKIENGK